MASFIVRLSWAPRGRLSGIVERAATGEKCRFTDVNDVGGVIAQIVEAERRRQIRAERCTFKRPQAESERGHDLGACAEGSSLHGT